MSETIHDAAAAYALGVLDPNEDRAFEAHLSGCERCRREVASHEETLAAVAEKVPEVPPPEGLRARVLSAAREARSAAGPGRKPKKAPKKRAGMPWWGVAAALAAGVAGIGWFRTWNEAVQLEVEVTALEEAVEIRDRAIEERDSLLQIALDLEARDARLVATDQPPSARLVWSPERSRVILSVADLAPAPEGRTYQLWGIPDGGDPVSIGLFDTGPSGGGVYVLAVPEGLDMAVSAVTEEPEGGSPQPTTTPFLVGTVTQ